MMGYNNPEIEKEYTRRAAGKLFNRKLISASQLEEINIAFRNSLYSPSFFVRLGLFIFTIVLINSVSGIFFLILQPLFRNFVAVGLLMIAASVVFILILNYLINKKHHYRSGIDDCLLYAGNIFFIVGIILASQITDPVYICIFILPVLSVSAWYYRDSLVAVLAMLTLYILLFLLLKEYSTGRLLMPFIFLVISIVLVTLWNGFLRKEALFLYERCLNALLVVSLLLLYGSVNYFIVREGNLLINDIIPDSIEMQVPFAGWFLLLTILIPIIYIIAGLKNRNRLYLWTGLGLIFVAFLTLKYRFDQLEYKYLLTGTGFVILTGTWIVIRYLKTHSIRFTFYKEPHEVDLTNAEGVLISQSNEIPQTGQMGFGGGHFGGGGAGGSL